MSDTLLANILLQSTDRLTSVSPTSRLDAEVLICFALNWDRSKLYTDSNSHLKDNQIEKISALIKKREHGEPVAYIVGKQEFWSMDLKVTSETLIPRPETEHLVEAVLAKISKNHSAKICELGTGSGAISIAILKERPNCTMIATDISQQALNVAKQNADLYASNNLEFFQSNWFENIEETHFDIVVSNPPYIAKDDIHLNKGDLLYEPKVALVAEDNGLLCIKTIVNQSMEHLKPNGWVLLEHGWNQADDVRMIFKINSYKNITTLKDYSNIDRITMAQKP